MSAGWAIELELKIGALDLHVAMHTEAGPVAIVGPNGAGKTTLLRVLAGAIRPARGRIALADRVLFDAAASIDTPPELRRVGYVPQGHGLFAHLSVIENVAFGLPGPRKDRRERAAAILERFSLTALAERRPLRLSGGERQRVALARALAVDPAGLLLDEPLAALDVSVRRATRALLVDHLRARALPTLLVTHDPRDAVALNATVFVLEAGRIVQSGFPEALAADPATQFVAELFGAPVFGGREQSSGPRLRAEDRGADSAP